MGSREELVDFSILEGSKENIQSLPGGRSAKQLAAILSPISSGGGLKAPTPDETKTLNDAIRQEYEKELQSIADKDDPLDVYDRYVKWALGAYTSVQATRESQLLPLLERATKAFLTAAHYKNDPRYLRLWLNYIKYFSDAPRETFSFLARHNIGETLSLFYEEFAAWFEINGRWTQAEEVYKLGLEKEAWPVERLMKKYEQFQRRLDARPQDNNEPTSPAVPRVRAALAAKVDPFAPHATEDSQIAAQQAAQQRPTISRSGKPKMAIFSDTESEAPAPTHSSAQGWDSIGSMKDRRKENTVEAKPWSGEKLNAGSRVGASSKMQIFKDPSIQKHSSKKPPPSKIPDVVNPKTGRVERVFVDIEAVYPGFPDESIEYSFEELRAQRRGWTDRDWSAKSPLKPTSGNADRARGHTEVEPEDVENLTHSFQGTSLLDASSQAMTSMPDSRPAKPRRMKVREVKQEAQTVKTRLESPTGRKLKRKGSVEPTMTFHSKAATNDIYDMFNESAKLPTRDDTQSGNETEDDDDTYSTAGDSTGTGRISAATSEFGDETLARVAAGGALDNETQSSQPTSVSPWSEFTTSKHVPKIDLKTKSKKQHKSTTSEDLTDQLDSLNQTQTSGIDSFDTQAIAAIANQSFDELKTQDIARLAGDIMHSEDEHDASQQDDINDFNFDSVKTPIDSDAPADDFFAVHTEKHYVPIAPEGYEPTPLRPYRDPAEVAQNKLPFMTPIAEQTESSIGSTVHKNGGDYFKTPSRKTGSQRIFESPSNLNLEALAMSSPQHLTPQRTPTPQKPSTPGSKRRIVETIENGSPLAESPLKKYRSDLVKNDDLAMPTSPPEELSATASPLEVFKAVAPEPAVPPTPIIDDRQCNPIASDVRSTILAGLITPITAYEGYSESKEKDCSQYDALKRYTQIVKNGKGSPKKAAGQAPKPEPRLTFPNTSRVYAVKRELGEGAYATAFLAHSSDGNDPSTTPSITPTSSPRKSLATSRSVSPILDASGRADYEAIKAEQFRENAPSVHFEFHIIRLAHSRVSRSDPRTVASLIKAHECHLYRDEAYLILTYSPQGTLLELLNSFTSDNFHKGKPTDGVGLDEPLAMFFSIEVLRTMEALHKVGILHGDLKADNCLVRFDLSHEITTPWNADGNDGWAARGLTLIDFGRGIDTKCFRPDAKFIADWTASTQDCPEIQECKPWKWSLDFYGAAGVIHSLLFGRYLSTITVPVLSENGTGVEGEMTLGIKCKKEVRIKETMKRYLSKEVWSEVFGVLLNKGGVDDDEVRMGELRRVRMLMEEWLDREGERKDLRRCMRAAERFVAARK